MKDVHQLHQSESGMSERLLPTVMYINGGQHNWFVIKLSRCHLRVQPIYDVEKDGLHTSFWALKDTYYY